MDTLMSTDPRHRGSLKQVAALYEKYRKQNLTVPQTQTAVGFIGFGLRVFWVSGLRRVWVLGLGFRLDDPSLIENLKPSRSKPYLDPGPQTYVEDWPFKGVVLPTCGNFGGLGQPYP